MTKLHRRALLGAAGLLPLAALPRLGFAQGNWPARPVRFIVPFTPAGTTDIAARILAEQLHQRLGQAFPIENRGGAGGNIGSEVAAKAEPDGYTILMQTVSSGAINYALYAGQIGYKPSDLANVGLLIKVPNVIFVNPELPVKNLRELVALAKSKPNELNHGSSGAGTSLHMTGELLKLEAGIQMTHVPFRGAGPMMAEIMAGRVEVGVDNLPSAIGHIREGRLRALAVTTPVRSPALPDVPTTAEEGLPGVEATGWFGVQAPAKTPKPVIDKLGATIDAVVKDKEVWARLADLGGMKPDLTPDGGTSPEAFETFVAAEVKKWAEVVRRSGAKVDG
ncbi:Bug family tripartite tricarboxylate transporter substrate binding protein [Roseomonas marmotae]|uniref:Tripartite tricarboxylate transporter substrate binding protein n=1 Tax=Roseomonas marmotae TaxID=2768161 RepID=A0ABS3K911_9PROT|nr:tripartite tricarboxylate transporter substrate binding protein [Roseomonas marmotae]MBO1073415.1 tripartite tricarboxylate transporter substrate binding protein [Roseomonas marmotae]QTI80388.1 tripartite tricarboxylate transporter substrate binding protein [Roseomonas marmotae]